MRTRRSFFGLVAGAAAAATAAPAAIAREATAVLTGADLVLPRTSGVNPLIAKLYSKRLAIEAVTGTYAERFLADHQSSLIQTKR